MARHIRKDGQNRAALIYFKNGVSTKEAEDALRKIGHLLKPTYIYGEKTDDPGSYVQEYDPEMGSPVWYIP